MMRGRRLKSLAAASVLSLSCASRPTEPAQSDTPTEQKRTDDCAASVGLVDAGSNSAEGSAEAPSDAGAVDGGVQTGGLAPEQIRKVVIGNAHAFQCCYEFVLRKDPNAQGGVMIAFTVSTGGTVSDASATSSSLGYPEVDTCMVDVFRKLTFPAADKRTNAMFPFVFRKR